MRIIISGQEGAEVELLQLALIRAGFEIDGGIDGVFGEGTQVALNGFQKSRRLRITGIADRNTWSLLQAWIMGRVIHRVSHGDTVYNLAERYGTTVRAIESRIHNPFELKEGSKVAIPFDFRVVPEGLRFSSTLLEMCINGLLARYPFLHRGSIGRSVLGKQLHYIRVGKGRRKVFYNASHHAEEWISSMLLMRFLEDYSEAYLKNNRIFGHSAKRLYEEASLYIVPMVNPDGVDLATGMLRNGSRAYEKAAKMEVKSGRFPENWRANINGVDLNLQYPAGWEKAREIKAQAGYTKPGARDYPGMHPLSEPESRAVYQFTSEKCFDIAIAYHTQGQVIYWKYSDAEPEYSRETGEDFAALSGYELDDAPAFSAHAGFKDWFIDHFKRPAYTVEAGIGTNPLPLEQFEQIYKENIGILVYGLLPHTR